MFRKPPCGNLLNIYLWRTSFLFFFYNFFYKCVLISDVFFSNVIKLVSRVSCICWMYLCCICVRLISHWCNAFIEKDWKCKLSRVGMVQDTVSNFISNCFRTVNLIKKSALVISNTAFWVAKYIHASNMWIQDWCVKNQPYLIL